MSGRISKRSRKTAERRDLSAIIDRQGAEADMPCTYCFRNKKPCRFDDKSTRCSECVRRGRSCDGTFVANSCLFLSFFQFLFLTFSVVNRLIDQREKLEQDEEKAEEALERLQSQLQEAVSRLSRIRKIRKKVKERSDELFQRGMEELDKEDGITPVLDSHERWIENDLNFMGVPSDVNWADFGLGDGFADVTPIGGVVPDETVAQGAGSSSSV